MGLKNATERLESIIDFSAASYERLGYILCFLYNELSDEFNNKGIHRHSNISWYLQNSTIWRALAYALFRSDKEHEIFKECFSEFTDPYVEILDKIKQASPYNGLVRQIVDNIYLVLIEFSGKEKYSLIDPAFKEEFKLHKLTRMRCRIEQVRFGGYKDEFKIRSLTLHKRSFRRLTGIWVDPELPFKGFGDMIDKELHVISSEATKIRGEYKDDKPN